MSNTPSSGIPTTSENIQGQKSPDIPSAKTAGSEEIPSYADLLKQCKLVGAGIAKLAVEVDDLEKEVKKECKEAKEERESDWQRTNELGAALEEEKAAWEEHGQFMRATFLSLAAFTAYAAEASIGPRLPPRSEHRGSGARQGPTPSRQ